ncbi:aldehyde dehydrogenase family protein [Fibrobacter sp. UWB11]|uniref:aldehyde dehydrogenase family protein n=1 Tax=Fibrobacter sp. UWB11 TaxID=1896202 RepID=UPI000929C2D1|nr:aldehyde dehydrogenase family protein [Fibrobacter sp. UWB11]SIO07087.1 aldehyde dehydrogenase (NAD+) [Fibrobacter sp. UWB11]
MNEIQEMDIERIFEAQGQNRWKIAQTTAKERIKKLKKLRAAVIQRQVYFYNAVWLDFHKPKFEAWLSEVFPIIEEIDYNISHLKRWMKDKKASRVFFLPTSKSVLHYEPKGRVLIFSPWNYPYLLLVNPIISAIAAGNVIMAKPSRKTPHVSAFLAKLFADTFPENEIAIIEGNGSEIGDKLLALPFDHIFFTGSPNVGAHIAEMAAKNHASITLELGGKSPAIILPKANIKRHIKQIAWGKTLNAGQTCIAPDYALCPQDKVHELAEAFASEIKRMFGDTDAKRHECKDFVHIVDRRATERHAALIKDAIAKGATQVIGGVSDIENCYTPITVLTNVTPDMEIMKSEIFGPILPIVSYNTLEEAIQFVQSRPKPLALYIFGTNKREIDYVLSHTTSGSSCVNNTIIQIENLDVPFGGVGMSGTGNYHGFYGFKTFSHERNIMRQKGLDVVTFFHPPYGKNLGDLHSKIQGLAEKALRFIKSM